MVYQPPPTDPLTHSFLDYIVRTTHGVDLPVRIFPAEDDGTPRPWLFWIHGGGYIAGKHYHPIPFILPAFLDGCNYHVISVAHRLTPQVSFPELFDDIQASFDWCLTQLPHILGERRVDRHNYFVGGDSSGGHLALLAGIRFEPRPKVVVDVYGITDPTDKHFENKVPSGATEDYDISDTLVQAALADKNPENAVVSGPWNWEMEPLLSVKKLQLYWGTPYLPGERDKVRMNMNNNILKEGSMMKVLFRADEMKDQKQYQDLFKKWSPLHILESQSSYPPTVLLHGTEDMVVPVQQSERLANRFKEMGVEVKELYKEGGEHGFGYGYTAPTDEGWREYVQPLVEFVGKHLEKENVESMVHSALDMTLRGQLAMISC
ncbi:hypothetical protein IAT40_002665 [Kwoniella sp. CBS 6097]